MVTNNSLWLGGRITPVVFIVTLTLVIAVGGIGIGLAWKTSHLDNYLPTGVKEFFGRSKETSEKGEARPEEDPTKDWKTYTNAGIYKYQIQYPPDWTFIPPEEPEYDWLVTFVPPSGVTGDGIFLDCPRGAGKHKTKLPDPYDWVPNEGDAIPLYVKRGEFNEMEGIQYVWGSPVEMKEEYAEAELSTAVLRKPEPLVCELSTYLDLEGREGIENPRTFDYERAISELITYNLMLSTFEFWE